jgi:type II secretory ATPase GspE/PulE/Tfp pilus assembly ATPase PilB-like protein
MKKINKEIGEFWNKFTTLIGSGIPIVKTLESVKEEIEDGAFKKAVEGVIAKIKDGTNLSDSIEAFPAFFLPTVVTLVKGGEVAGQLEVSCAKIVKGYTDGTFHSDTAGKIDLDSVQITEDSTSAEPVVKALNLMFLEAIKKGASDIHCEWISDKMRIRLRIDGVLKAIEPPPKDIQKAFISRMKVMACMDVAEKRVPQDGRIMIKVNDKELDLRVSTIPHITGETVVMRILQKEKVVLDINKLWFSEQNLETVKRLISSPTGVIIVTGPTGSGKTTTLYAMLSELNREEVKIITTENPVEYLINGLTQQQLIPSKGFNYVRGIRAMLRQDPDIMMVGEIRDFETASLITQASLTGHLVFTTLHTMDAPGAVRRLLDIGIKPFLVNSTVIGVISQRLIRKICDNCKEEYTPEEWMFEAGEEYRGKTFFKGKGCDKCNNTGYKGRIAIHGVMEFTNELKKLTAGDPDTEAIRAKAVAGGMKTLIMDGMDKALQGMTTIEEVLRVIPVE